MAYKVDFSAQSPEHHEMDEEEPKDGAYPCDEDKEERVNILGLKSYNEVAWKSQGFDLLPYPHIKGSGKGIYPRVQLPTGGIMPITDLRFFAELLDECILAVTEAYLEERNEVLEFVRIVKANSSLCNMWKLYVTFDAKDSSSSFRTYQTQVIFRRAGPEKKCPFDVKVLLLRVRPQDEEGGSSSAPLRRNKRRASAQLLPFIADPFGAEINHGFLASKEEFDAYVNEVKEYQGFSVKHYESLEYTFKIICPILDIEGYAKILHYCTGKAIEAYNEEDDNEKEKIEFKKIVEANYQICSPLKFYITFEASDHLGSSSSSSGQIKTYESLVTCRNDEKIVECVRLQRQRGKVSLKRLREAQRY